MNSVRHSQIGHECRGRLLAMPLTETELYILTVLNAKKRPGTHVPANCDRVGENEPCRSQNDETA